MSLADRATYFDQARKEERRLRSTPSPLDAVLLEAAEYRITIAVMDNTSKFSSESVTEPSEEIAVDGAAGKVQDKGFFGLLIQSIFEVSRFESARTNIQPGANQAVVLAMNVSFFLLLIVLFGLAFLTGWNFHVVMMLVVSALLWASMIWSVSLTRPRP